MTLGGSDEWQQAMRAGAFARAWRISDRVLSERLANAECQQHLPRHLQAVWTGEPLAGKHVLVRCYHGLGDTVQYIRLAHRLRRRAREVTLWVQPPLLSLAATAAGVNRVLPLHDGVPGVAYDVDIEIMELAHALRITPADLPGPVPYFRSVPAVRIAPRLPSLTVGLVWSGGDWDTRRGVALRDLEPLLAVPDVRFVSLQRGPARAQCHGSDIVDASSDDVDVFAARLRRLDLLVSIDTFAAHLAGALGVPVWTMLHSACDWRWGDAGGTSVWYPTMRLFRQRRADDWTSVVVEMAHALARVARHRAQRCRNKAIDVTFAP